MYTACENDQLGLPIIVTFYLPTDPRFAFEEFYDRLRRRGCVIYPGKVTAADSFRIGYIGRLNETDMRGALTAIRAVLNEMGLRAGAGDAIRRGHTATSRLASHATGPIR